MNSIKECNIKKLSNNSHLSKTKYFSLFRNKHEKLFKIQLEMYNYISFQTHLCREIIHSKLYGHFSTTASMFYSYNPPLVVDSRLLRHRDHRRGRQRNRHLDRYRYAHFCKLFSRIYGKVSCF